MKRLSFAVPAYTAVSVTIVLGALCRRTGSTFGTAMRWFRRGLPMAVEAIMMVGSARLAYTLLSNQSYFDTHFGPYIWITEHGEPWSYEWVWGLMAGSGAILKAIGIALCVFYRRDPVMSDLGYGIRLIAWLASCIVWGTMTISYSRWDPLSALAIAASCAFALAIWGLFMGPSMPDDDVG